MWRPTVHPAVWRAAQLLLWVVIAVVALRAGLNLRSWTWTQTASIRFRGDIANAVDVSRGTLVPPAAAPRADDPTRVDWSRILAGYLTRYDREADRIKPNARGQTQDRQYSFDYPPGRLLIVTLWTAPTFVERGLGAPYDDAFAGPMLRVNAAHEIVAAIGIFAFVRRSFRHAGRGRFVSELAALSAALLAWFNPTAIMNGHGWPQWDVWVLPYTIWAAYCGLAGRWLVAGALLATGAMFKGQVLLIAPFFALWPIFRLDGSALLRLLAGFGAALATLTAPWLLRASPAQVWAIGALALAVPPIVCPRRLRFTPLWWLAVAALAGWTLGPWLHPTYVAPAPWHAVLLVVALLPWERLRGWPLRSWGIARAAIVGGLASAAPMWLLGALALRWPDAFTAPTAAFTTPAAATATATSPSVDASLVTGFAAALLVAAVVGLAAVWRGRRAMWLAIFCCGVVALGAILYDGSTAWWRVGFQTDRYRQMALGRVANLPAILQNQFGLNVNTRVSLFGYLTADAAWTLRAFMRGIAFAGVGLAALAMALQQRRRDANLVLAIPAAWAMLFAFMPQMHERYLLWAAVTSAVCVTRGVGGLLAYLALAAVSVAPLYAQMVEVNRRGFGLLRDDWFRTTAGLQPSTGYITATIAITLLVWSFRRSAPPRALLAQPV